MLRRPLLALIALSLVLAASCGPSFRQIQVRALSEAEYLQAEAAAKNLRGEEITNADTYLARAKTAKSKESADFADLAAAYYRVALARSSAEESANTLARAEAALAVSREHVAKYQDILTRVNANAGGQ